MPTYQVFVNENKLNSEQKKAVAAAITDGHCRQTGAPGYYVQVIIQEIAGENRYICGKQFDRNMWIRGDVRCRTPEQNRELMLELADCVSKVCDFEKDMIWCDLCGIASTDIMKFQTVFPPAGQEQSWYDALPEEIQKLYDHGHGKRKIAEKICSPHNDEAYLPD